MGNPARKPADTPTRVYVFLAVGLLALSQSANIIRLADAHPFAITAWRLILATALLAPMANRKLAAVRCLSPRMLLVLLVGIVALTTHFFSWIQAVQTTTVANATLFLSINPVITAAAAYLIFRERAGRNLKVALALGAAGVSILAGSDLSFSPEHIPGDLMSLLSSLLFTVYFMAAKKLRQQLDAIVSVTLIYGGSAVLSFIALPVWGLPLVDYDAQTWATFALMAIVPTMVGHSSLNYALKFIDAGKISAFTLVEPLLAGLVAAVAWGEAITPLTLLGYLLICGSVLMVALGEARTRRPR